MSNMIAPWNPLQFVVICSFTAFTAFFIPPETGLSLVAVFVTLFVLCVPAIFVQIKLGGYLQKGIVGIFSMFFPIWKGVGIAALIDLLMRIATFAPLVAQFGTYAFIAISNKPQYVWGTCKNLQLTTLDKLCLDDEPSARNVIYGGEELHRPEELFYKHEFLQMSESPMKLDGFPQWRFTEIARKAEVSLMPVTLAIVWVLVFLFVGFGGRVCGWILFLLGPTALSCLLAVMGYGYAHLDSDLALRFLRRHYQVTFLDKDQLLGDWTKGFQFLMYSVPVWTAIAPTMGRMCGRGRKIRNIACFLMVIMFALVSQLPPIAMAPYIAKMIQKNHPNVAYNIGPELLLWQMPAAFTSLNIPPVYAFIFFLSAFLFSVMYLCLGCLTIVDNIVVGLEGWIERKACSKVAVHLLVTFFVMCIAKALGIIQTTKAGYHYSVFLDRAMFQLRFVLILLIALGLLVVYVKQNFALLERVMMAVWLGSSALTCAGLWFYTVMNGQEGGFIYQTYPPNYRLDEFSKDWRWVTARWLIASLPLIGVPLGALNACYNSCGTGSPACSKLCCGITERVREHQFDSLPPPPPPEPTAPPYIYTYMDNAYPLDDTYKMEYDPPETEPLRSHNSQTRI